MSSHRSASGPLATRSVSARCTRWVTSRRLGGFVGVLGFTCGAGLKFFDAAGLLPGVDELAVVGFVCLVFTKSFTSG